MESTEIRAGEERSRVVVREVDGLEKAGATKRRCRSRCGWGMGNEKKWVREVGGR